MLRILLQKIIYFLNYVKHKQLCKKQIGKLPSPQFPPQENLETALLSEASLQEDWLTPEEDEAWQHL
ncbi:hypothetical protein UH38_19660 [Aliterella atlantica CENA595]|uniref:DUF2281 domain-containing protein n=1 Tax=Aliterella atlantica CENA595 TaxID=1618023 RepID=A0A0D8ZP19_9CYAN|nr:hypothetical protein UH38_19660 [Aliterella atlantica CENA595]